MKKNILKKSLYILAVIFFLLFEITPIAWSFIVSITPPNEMLANSTNIFPKNKTYKNYETLLINNSNQSRVFKKGIKNSLNAVGLSIIIGIPLSIFAAYPLSRMKFKYRIAIRNILIATMAIPVFAVIIPLYKIYASFNLLDNMIALVLVYTTSFLPVSVWLLINYFDSLPKELEEAAYLDGYSRIGTMIKIILPLSLPAISGASLIVFLSTWNKFQIPLILSPSAETKPIAVVAAEFVTKYNIDYGLINAGGIIAVIPPVLITIIFKNFLISGMTQGSGK